MLQPVAAQDVNAADCFDKDLALTTRVVGCRAAAEQGHVRAQSSLGVMYYQGEGVQQAYTEAVKWFRRAAEQGDAAA